MWLFVVIILIMTYLGAQASVFLKKTSEQKVGRVFFSKYLYFGGVLYVAGALLNIYVLKYLDYSIVLPLTSITYIWTMILSYFYFRENISMQKIIGLGCIVIGCMLIAIR